MDSVLVNPDLETSCPCGAVFTRVEDPSTAIEDGRGGTQPAMLEPLRAACQRGHVYEVATFDVTKTGTAVTLGRALR